ncbi:zinc finger CCCH-type with G patch domain-containing protein [Melanotaenia boesemani]|uniref:zinc finger CCCH-type with G patch domain-containing protein n=1 Tax=Melanotaenia boesemani TaxID=1250792 RepID=UPI001C046086|nr:zinc finger CCCH-type with G patch domain-containing protein [Melanotaenia boesemani]XP_041860948.1 zinc finger CCCH-type with G patch domain-containing protein [Melanotaenia boesemani]XP_041860949.1 zinc finger CCCH-type with G patch domain-containing protein [Melanotaenia boesemani]
MDEETLEAAIATYGAQLQQVEMALSAGLDPSQQPDLLKLKEDLCQLIELTEASLVSVKKSRLLASIEDSNGLQVNTSEATADTSSGNGSLDAEFAAFYSEVGECSSSSFDTREKDMEEEGRTMHFEEEEEEEDEEEEDPLSGTKVRAPYRTPWGTLEYHNAMVVGSEPPDGEESQVKVLYIYPTQKSMKPCPFYLEDKCRFQGNCRFSHGEVVYVSELREFLECDLSNLEEGSSCLARHEDGIWYPAKITDIDSGFYTVKFDSLLLKDAVVEADSIIPPLREDDPISSDSDDTGDGDTVAYAKVLDSAEESAVELSSANFGGWEAHTRGIGSKLMLKMGYEYGKGLGKMQEGRVEPVMAVVLPKGKSLDECAELTQRRTQSKTAKDGSPTGRPKRRRKPRVTTRGSHTVFDFLNHKLGGRSSGPADGVAAAPLAATGLEAYRGGKTTKRSLNVKLFQAAQRVSQTEKEIQKLSELISRQTGRDTSRVKQLEEKLSAARRLLAQQKAHELSVQKEHKKADTHKKMTEF